jgi:hypothetical protein
MKKAKVLISLIKAKITATFATRVAMRASGCITGAKPAGFATGTIATTASPCGLP